jgi:hypothetical protein
MDKLNENVLTYEWPTTFKKPLLSSIDAEE